MNNALIPNPTKCPPTANPPNQNPKPTPLPEPLRYLHPFLKSLTKLPPDQLNEDLDPTPLESALRNRLRGLDEDAAEAARPSRSFHEHLFLL